MVSLAYDGVHEITAIINISYLMFATIWIIFVFQTDLEDIKTFYKQSYKVSLYDAIYDKCKGGYAKILLAIVGKN